VGDVVLNWFERAVFLDHLVFMISFFFFPPLNQFFANDGLPCKVLLRLLAGLSFTPHVMYPSPSFLTLDDSTSRAFGKAALFRN